MHELTEKIKEAANKLKVTVSEFLALGSCFVAFYNNQAIDIHSSFAASDIVIQSGMETATTIIFKQKCGSKLFYSIEK